MLQESGLLRNFFNLCWSVFVDKQNQAESCGYFLNFGLVYNS